MLAALVVPRVVLAQGCAMCGSALGDGSLGQAFNTSILFMMAAPYAIVGTVGGWLFYKYRTAARPRATVLDFGPAADRPSQPAAAGPTGGDVP